MPANAHPAALRPSIPSQNQSQSQSQSQTQNQNQTQNHRHSRTTSSNIFPTIVYPEQEQRQRQPQHYPQQHTPSYQQYPQHPQQPPQGQYASNNQMYPYTQRRTPSQGTFSTASSGNAGPLRPPSQDFRRSTPSRSSTQPAATGYVALLRRQKATVWCDRAQQEDPRLIAAKKAAKMKAALEVVGGSTPGTYRSAGISGSGGKGGVASKIRNHGKASLVGFNPGDLVGGVGGVPLRLSATEVEGEDSDDDVTPVNRGYHHRSGSGRSSIASSRRGPSYSRQSGASSTVGKWSSGNTPPDSLHDLAENPTPADIPGDGTRSAGSGSSAERADQVGDLTSNDAARLASNSLLQSTITREKSVRNPEELRRRGSVDERTMTMSAGRLYIANPDADSD